MTTTRARRPAVPFGRQGGTGSEVAHARLFLISHESSFVNADAPAVDGGLSSGVARTTPATQWG